GLIVAVAVLILLGFRYLVGGARTTENYLRALDSPNADIRWRGAHDLAQVLKRPESLALASDPHFALDLAERLRRALDELDRAEGSHRRGAEPRGGRNRRPRRLGAHRPVLPGRQAGRRRVTAGGAGGPDTGAVRRGGRPLPARPGCPGAELLGRRPGRADAAR